MTNRIFGMVLLATGIGLALGLILTIA